MVIFIEWPLSPVNLKSTCGLPMSGEDTGLEATASPMVGYLGKVQERAASLDHCPWCSKKGLKYPLRSYHINLEESITLCTNPQCLFPLVSRPLEDVLSCLVPVEPTTGNKRKNPSTLVADEPTSPSVKRLRTYYTENNGHNTESINGNANYATVNSPQTKELELSQQADHILEKDSTTLDLIFCLPSETDHHKNHSSETPAKDKVLSSCNNIVDGKDCFSNNVALDFRSQDVDVLPNESSALLAAHNDALGETEPIPLVEDTCLESEADQSKTDLSITKTDSEKLVSAPTELFWSNRDNLCWLDSLLAALVNFRLLRKLKPKDEPYQSPVWKLLSGHEEACSAIEAHRTDDDFLKVPNHLLHKVNNDLETHRMSIFNLLQPKLHCKLGQNETPVFALPLLIKMDSWLEPLFQTKFYWDFRCQECKGTTKENVVKTLPTFTNIVPDWHPLRAVHLAPCNVCHRKNQRRRMVLEGVPPVFALHFVEGLPDNNIQVYNFSFKKKHYSVTAFIQYNSHLKHFATWVHKSDGSWVEFDDLKHPHSKTYKTLPVPARDIHVVFWEEDEERQESRACSPSSTFTEYPTLTHEMDHSVSDMDNITEDLVQYTSDQSLNKQNETDIISALSEQDTTFKADIDSSIGSTTLLDAFEGLSHSDIITLTLVEMKEDSKTQPLDNNDAEIAQTQDTKCPDVNSVIQDSPQDICAPAPDSSSALGAIETPKEADSELSTVSEPDDNSSDDPTFEPNTRRRGKRGRAAASKPAKKQKVENQKSKAAPIVTTNAPVSEVENTPTTVKPPPPVSSTVSAPQLPPVVQKEQQKGWSTFLKRSFSQIQNNSPKITPTPIPKAKQKPITLVCSTPKPQKESVPVKVLSKPGLRKEENGLPLKAAEMYGAFGSKKTNSFTVNATKKPPESSIQNPGSANTVVNNSLHFTSIAGVQPQIICSKKTKSSKIPPGLSETEALRYKLMKKLKAKKKKLAKLDEMLGQQGDASFKPDSTNLNSPNTVTSSTYDGSTCDEFLSELLSPATTITSNLSPDSTEYLEMFTNAQEAPYEEMQTNTVVQGSVVAGTEDFFDEFMSQAVAERPTEMEAEALIALDLFF